MSQRNEADPLNVKATYQLTESVKVSLLNIEPQHVKDEQTLDILYTEVKDGTLVRVQFSKKRVRRAVRTNELYIKVKAPEFKAHRRVYLREFVVSGQNVAAH